MANNFLDTQLGKSELKDAYDPGSDSIYEAIRRKRKKRIEKLALEDVDMKDDNEAIRTQFPKPD